ncbi:MAG TPA: xylulokinase [Bauldia sp.]|nr:xylulokinase [Bauldia sp.]
MFLGIDIGTTAVKAIIVDGDQQLVAAATREHPTARPQPGWSEQNPDDWLAAVRGALVELRTAAANAYAAIEAIGLSGQMHSAVLLGADLRPVMPALLWNDSRGTDECAELTRRAPGLAAVTGVQAMAGFSAAKLLWLGKHRAADFARIAHVMLAKDYVRLWLTGEIGSDMSDAAGTQLFDEANRKWWPDAVAAVGLRDGHMPPLHEGPEVAGRLRAELAAELGLTAGLPVAAGGGDAGTGSLGVGCIARGEGFVSLGTAAVFVVADDRYAPRPETMLHNFAHCLPRRWYQMAGMLNGASVVRWALDIIGETDIAGLMRKVEARYRGPSHVLFLPYLTGERTPHNNPDARGVFYGLAAGTDKVDLMQAVLEGVAFSLKDARNCLIAAGADCPRPGFLGGGSRNRLWGQIIASVTGLTLIPYRGAEFGPALGAARLAIMAATNAGIEEVGRKPEEGEPIAPDMAMHELYAPQYERYRELYRSVAPLFQG